MFSAKELTAIGNICVDRGVIILSDEVYERLHYTESFPRIATLDPRFARNTVTIGSIGKSFSATGWRVGYAIGDQDLIKHMQAAHIILSFTTAGPAQLAAAFGLEQAEQTNFWEDHKREMKRKIDSLGEVFQELGLPVCCVLIPAPRSRSKKFFVSSFPLTIHRILSLTKSVVRRTIWSALCPPQRRQDPIPRGLSVSPLRTRQDTRLEALLVSAPRIRSGNDPSERYVWHSPEIRNESNKTDRGVCGNSILQQRKFSCRGGLLEICRMQDAGRDRSCKEQVEGTENVYLIKDRAIWELSWRPVICKTAMRVSL